MPTIYTICFLTFGPFPMSPYNMVLVDNEGTCIRMAQDQEASFVGSLPIIKGSEKSLELFCGPELKDCADQRSK